MRISILVLVLLGFVALPAVTAEAACRTPLRCAVKAAVGNVRLRMATRRAVRLESRLQRTENVKTAFGK